MLQGQGGKQILAQDVWTHFFSYQTRILKNPTVGYVIFMSRIVLEYCSSLFELGLFVYLPFFSFFEVLK